MQRPGITAAALALAAGSAIAQTPAQDPEKKEEPAVERMHALMVGDEAPGLEIQTWVKGEAVEAFAQGVVYVVEFWATWCGPCIRGMPHLSDLQEAYAEKGVRIIGVNIWDEPDNVAPFMAKEIPIHGKSGAEVMRYTVAIESKDDPTDRRNGKMAELWMEASGRGGIPSAFIVDQTGHVAWIGHPGSMDGALEKIVAGKWDLAVEAVAYAARLEAEVQLDEYLDLFRKRKYEEAYALGHELMRGALFEDSAVLNQMAWMIVDPDRKPGEQDLDLALKAAGQANELTESEDPAILDTLAVVHHQRGDLAKAVQWQRLAAKHGEGSQFEAEIGVRLEQFEKELEQSQKKGDGTG